MCKNDTLFGVSFCLKKSIEEKMKSPQWKRREHGWLNRGLFIRGYARRRVRLLVGVDTRVERGQVGPLVRAHRAVGGVAHPGLLRRIGSRRQVRDRVGVVLLRVPGRNPGARGDGIELDPVAFRGGEGVVDGAFHSHLLDARVGEWNIIIIAHIYKNINIQYTSTDEENSSYHLISRNV